MSKKTVTTSIWGLVVVGTIVGFVITSLSYFVHWSSARDTCLQEGVSGETINAENKGWPLGYVSTESTAECQGLLFPTVQKKSYAQKYLADVAFWSLISGGLIFAGMKIKGRKK